MNLFDTFKNILSPVLGNIPVIGDVLKLGGGFIDLFNKGKGSNDKNKGTYPADFEPFVPSQHRRTPERGGFAVSQRGVGGPSSFQSLYETYINNMAPKGFDRINREVASIVGRPVAGRPASAVSQVSGGRRKALAKQSSITSRLT